MSEDLNYICKIIKRILNAVLIIGGIYLGCKLAVFYMPFLIAFIIALMIEPAIKALMKKTKMTRKACSIIIFVIVFSIIIGCLVWGIISLVSESTNLLQMLNLYIDRAYTQIQDAIGKLNITRVSVSKNMLSLTQDASKEMLLKVSKWLTVFFKQINRYCYINTNNCYLYSYNNIGFILYLYR